MAKILPSINCHRGDFEAVRQRCREIAAIFAAANVPAAERWAHFDVADGVFTFHKSWNEPERLKESKAATAFSFEAHLMVEEPRPEVERWLAAGAERIAVHLEAVPPEDFAALAVAVRDAGAEIVLALNPETPGEAVRPYLEFTSHFLVLTVHPGLSGQKFLPLMMDKVAFLRREVPAGKIEVDGGINPKTARVALDAGADALVSDTDIFGAPDPEAQYQKLRSL